MNDDFLMKFVLAELIEEMGGVVRLNAEKMLKDIQTENFKAIEFKIYDGQLIAEVHSEDED